MANLNILEELRTRKELEDYFKQLSKEITEEEINNLKQSYKQAEENNGALSLQQLADVAGGMPPKVHGSALTFCEYRKQNPEGNVDKYLSYVNRSEIDPDSFVSAIRSIDRASAEEALNNNPLYKAYTSYKVRNSDTSLKEFYLLITYGSDQAFPEQFQAELDMQFAYALQLDTLLNLDTDYKG